MVHSLYKGCDSLAFFVASAHLRATKGEVNRGCLSVNNVCSTVILLFLAVGDILCPISDRTSEYHKSQKI